MMILLCCIILSSQTISWPGQQGARLITLRALNWNVWQVLYWHNAKISAFDSATTTDGQPIHYSMAIAYHKVLHTRKMIG